MAFPLIAAFKGMQWGTALMKYVLPALAVVAVIGGIYLFYKGWKSDLIEQGSLQEQVKQQEQVLKTMKEDMDKLKESNKSTQEALDSLRQQQVNIEQFAKNRAAQLDRKIRKISEDPTLTPEQRDQAVHREYGLNIRDNQCRIFPDLCKHLPKPAAQGASK